MEYEAVLPIDPMPCPRPRVAVIRGHGVAYYPAAYKRWVQQFTELFEGREITPFEGPVEVSIILYVRKPRTSKLRIPGGDVDNYAKSVLDGLTKVGMWADDKQVSSLYVAKLWAPPDPCGSTAGIAIRIKSIQ